MNKFFALAITAVVLTACQTQPAMDNGMGDSGMAKPAMHTNMNKDMDHR